MICRIWTARATAANSPRYIAIARDRVLADLRKVPGFRGALVLSQTASSAQVNIQFLTLWDSMDAIRAFAGEDPGRAVVLPEAEAILEHAGDRAEHWTVDLCEPIAQPHANTF